MRFVALVISLSTFATLVQAAGEPAPNRKGRAAAIVVRRSPRKASRPPAAVDPSVAQQVLSSENGPGDERQDQVTRLAMMDPFQASPCPSGLSQGVTIPVYFHHVAFDAPAADTGVKKGGSRILGLGIRRPWSWGGLFSPAATMLSTNQTS